MKEKSGLKYILVLPFILIVGIFIYWYLNPSIDNEDFHLQYLLSDGDKNFYEFRNQNINQEKFTYNNEMYSNNIEGYKLIIYSIDFTKFGEKILIITDSFDKKTRNVNLTYKDKNGIYSPLEIVKNNDSILINQISEDPKIDKHLVFKGCRIKM